MTRVLIADDHAVVRRGLAEIVNEALDLKVTGQAADGEELVGLLREGQGDLVVMDLKMPGLDGLDLVKQLRHEFPTMPILVMSMHPEDQFAVRVLRAGATGYLTKNSAPTDLVRAVRKVAEGRRYVSPQMAETLLDAMDSDPEEAPHEALSDREYQVLRLLASGKLINEISEELALSPKTVSTYRLRLLQKMNMKSNAEITRYALENDLIQ
ncbi:MAG: response regulator transcription factor [Bacteroidota bacterium]